MAKYSVDCRYTPDQFRRSMVKFNQAKDPNESDETNEKKFKVILLNIIFGDISKEQDLISRLKVILNKQVPISLASEILEYLALGPNERSLMYFIYKDELSSKFKNKGHIYKFSDLINYFIARDLNIDEKNFLLELLPYLNEIPQTREILKRNINEVPEDLIMNLFEDFSNDYNKNSDLIKFFKLLSFVIETDSKVFIKIINQKFKDK